MKKSILVLFLLAGSVAGFSQGVSFGIKAGVNIAKETASGGSISISNDSKVDIVGGVYLKAMITDKFGIQPEILYSGQGGQTTDNGTTYKDKFVYLSVPVLARWQVTPLFNLHAGPQFGILMSAKSDGDDIKDQMKSSDIGLAFGAGIDLPVGVNFTARYVAGLTNILKSDDNTGDITVKNQVIQVTVGFKLFGK